MLSCVSALSLTQVLQSELQHGHSFLKSLRERAEQAAGFLDETGAESLGGEVEGRLAQLEELAGGLRQEHSFLDRALLLAKEFQDRYKGQAQWLVETRALLNTPVEPKAELYQRRAQLAKYKVKLFNFIFFHEFKGLQSIALTAHPVILAAGPY